MTICTTMSVPTRPHPSPPVPTRPHPGRRLLRPGRAQATADAKDLPRHK